MNAKYGTRDIVRNPSLLRIGANDSYMIEDKKTHTPLGVYLGVDLAKEFFEYEKKKKLLESAKKIKQSALKEYGLLEGALDDGL
ncbi:MAG: hypothetical protein ACQESH_03945 [Campylobacterota bacterium]